jgi:hypothetical protein
MAGGDFPEAKSRCCAYVWEQAGELLGWHDLSRLEPRGRA